jgi:hypothetical protein
MQDQTRNPRQRAQLVSQLSQRERLALREIERRAQLRHMQRAHRKLDRDRAERGRARLPPPAVRNERERGAPAHARERRAAEVDDGREHADVREGGCARAERAHERGGRGLVRAPGGARVPVERVYAEARQRGERR